MRPTPIPERSTLASARQQGPGCQRAGSVCGSSPASLSMVRARPTVLSRAIRSYRVATSWRTELTSRWPRGVPSGRIPLSRRAASPRFCAVHGIQARRPGCRGSRCRVKIRWRRSSRWGRASSRRLAPPTRRLGGRYPGPGRLASAFKPNTMCHRCSSAFMIVAPTAGSMVSSWRASASLSTSKTATQEPIPLRVHVVHIRVDNLRAPGVEISCWQRRSRGFRRLAEIITAPVSG